MITSDMINTLSDKQILSEFVKRFNCDGAILIYKDSDLEVGFSNWSNVEGKRWAKHLLKLFKNDKSFTPKTKIHSYEQASSR